MPEEKTDNSTVNDSLSARLILSEAMNKNAMILAIFAFISTGLIATTYTLTKDKIAQEVERSLVKQLSEIVPPESYTNEVYQDCITIQDSTYLGTEEPHKLYRMRNDGEDFALLMTSVAPDGYSGRIQLTIAISAAGTILGVNILQHQETPGLGDKIDRNKSQWITQFDGLSPENLKETDWKVKKDGGQFDALTGATITPRAVVKAIYNGVQYFQKHKQSLFEAKSHCEKKI